MDKMQYSLSIMVTGQESAVVESVVAVPNDQYVQQHELLQSFNKKSSPNHGSNSIRHNRAGLPPKSPRSKTSEYRGRRRADCQRPPPSPRGRSSTAVIEEETRHCAETRPSRSRHVEGSRSPSCSSTTTTSTRHSSSSMVRSVSYRQDDTLPAQVGDYSQEQSMRDNKCGGGYTTNAGNANVVRTFRPSVRAVTPSVF